MGSVRVYTGTPNTPVTAHLQLGGRLENNKPLMFSCANFCVPESSMDEINTIYDIIQEGMRGLEDVRERFNGNRNGGNYER